MSELDLAVVAKDDELRFEVHARPRAKRTSIVGVRSQETLKTVPITFSLPAPSPSFQVALLDHGDATALEDA